MIIDFPKHLLLILRHDLVVILNVQGQHLLRLDDHHDPPLLPGSDQRLQIVLLVL